MGNTCVKRKRTSIFLQVIEFTNKNNKVLVDAMDQINSTHIDLYKNMTKYTDNNFKEHLKYLKDKDKKTHKMNKQMVNVLSNLSITMCHAFIKDQSLMPWGVYIFNSKSNE